MASEPPPPDTAELPSPSNSTQTSGSPSTAFAITMLLRPEYLSVVLTALGIIWLGAHGSLRRPPSAAPVKTKAGKRQPKEEKFAEGLVASDAIMFPVLAAGVLISLYYLIEWLQDPDLLNKIVRGYISIMAIASVGRLAGDLLHILTSFVFPSTWVDRGGTLYHIDADRHAQFVVDQVTGEERIVEEKDTPLPGRLSIFSRSGPSRGLLWGIRHLLTEEWTVKFAMHGLMFVKFNVRLNDLVGYLLSIPVAIAYHLTGRNALSNVLSTAMCYASFMLLSPTSFGIGTMVLWGLFVYDIVMVFYTPYMITVATKLDAPIKLVFESSGGVSMLGLGDIVVPGMLMGLALRFDLYQFYKKQIKLEPVDLTTELTTELASEHFTEKKQVLLHTQQRRVKAPFVDPRGQWGSRFWSTKFGSLSPVKEASSAIAATAFPKPYFYASVTGYFLGMMATLAMLVVFKHGQPALLYLVPGVTGALWLTALARGEIKDMLGYTEDGSLDTEDVVVEVDAEGNVVESKKEQVEEDIGKKPGEDVAEEAKPIKEQTAAPVQDEGDYDVFLFSITAPRMSLHPEG
ncbi:signal peptide peptidase-domain-containing protein [Podospora australis]|uniref:Signal peptide peptidase-domain-containing protein n=1 Tax=Podospora australis TaxID=1536484 RepID=A0AAN6WWP6_9PEZI|nr:signal peptide peptidase-domain-containing protein [Podospora australis]